MTQVTVARAFLRTGGDPATYVQYWNYYYMSATAVKLESGAHNQTSGYLSHVLL